MFFRFRIAQTVVRPQAPIYTIAAFLVLFVFSVSNLYFSMQRFYFDIPLTKTVSIADKEFFHQISHVMRVRPGDEIVLFNGDGWDCAYAIGEITKKEIILNQVSKVNVTTDSIVAFHLYQALPNKYEKIEYILQK
jgi:16S rRNA (uracil1498-N3)-methyltransferase